MDIIDLAAGIPPIQHLLLPAEHAYNVSWSMLRLDLIHPYISGNKWFKLRYNLQEAQEKSCTSILTFGGAWSNHLLATAAAAQLAGMHATGIVRGLHGQAQPTPTLLRCAEMGMQLTCVSRETYSRKNDPDYLSELQQQFPGSFIIPEGGANEAGRKGAALIASLMPDNYTHICVSVGTGTTLAGLRNALPVHQEIIGFVPMKGGQYLEKEIAGWLMPEQNRNWSVTDSYHFGGFGKSTAGLQAYIAAFHAQQGILPDAVYTGKMLFGIEEMIRNGKFNKNAKVLCIHTGGVQPA